MRSERKALWILSSAGGILGGLCCLTPIVMVMFGLASVSAATSLGNALYGDYKWLFRAIAALFLIASVVVYYRRRGICTLDDARRQRNRLINAALLVVFVSVGVYVLWTYVILHYWGIVAGLPWAQWDETWAIPTSGVILALAVLLTFLFRRSRAEP